MVKLKTPLLSFNASNTISNAFTFVKRRGHHIAEKKPEILDVKSPAQLSWRHMYQKCAALWHTLSAAEKEEWESTARPKHMTGFAWFQSQCLRPNPGIYLPLQGGTMQGDIDMAKNRLLKLPLPTDKQEAASKTYIDQALENFMWAKFLNDTPSGIDAYFEMAPDPTGAAKSTFTSGVLDTGDGQALFQWISDDVVTFTTIKVGIIRVHIHAQRIAGNKSIKLYAEVYEYTDAAAEILIATTETCDFLTDDEACIEMHAPLAADYDIAPTSKLLIKFLANVGAAGANVTLNLYAEGLTTSSISLPIPTSPLIDAEIAFHASIATAHQNAPAIAAALIAIHAGLPNVHHTPTVNYTEGARVYHDAHQSIPNTTLTWLAFNSEDYDTDSIHDNVVNNSRLTCKTAAKYIIIGGIELAGLNAGKFANLRIQLNTGTTIAMTGFNASFTGGTPQMGVSAIYDLSVDDYVELGVYHDHGAARLVQSFWDYSPKFAMQRIG